MPLLVTDYTWTQTQETVHIQVPLKGAKPGNVDIISTDEYIKLHYPPYLFEAFLSEPVEDERSMAKVGNGLAVITLSKRTRGTWSHLMIDRTHKEKMKEIRDRALLKYQEKLLSESRVKAEKKQAEGKYSVETMMKLEREQRDVIQKMKEAEREKVAAQLETWRQRREEQTQAPVHDQKHRHDNVRDATDSRGHGRSCGGDMRGGKAARSQKKQANIPAPRPSRSLRITHTPRVFPTPLRESKMDEEEKWLTKQAEARRAACPDVDELKDLQEEEKNPDWLKAKGDKHFAAGDYLSAVNAYSLAIRLSSRIPAVYSNRAACHLKLRNLHKAIEDSSQALDLLTPPVAANAAARARAHVRRGSAFCQLQLYVEGLQDYQAALSIQPQDEALQADAQRIRDIVQGTAATH